MATHCSIATFTAPISGACTGGGRIPLPAFCLPSASRAFVAVSQGQRHRLEVPVADKSSSLTAQRGVLRSTTRRRRRSRPTDLRCELTRLSGNAAHKVLPTLATRDQWSHFWGSSDMQRVGKFFEVSAIAFLGLWACYFTSFFLGSGATSLIGASFLFYWLLAPNLTAFRRNRALRGRIAPFPGGEGNSFAIFSARVASATEEYHPVTGEPVFMRMIIEDEDGRALKFRTRTRAEYARVRPGMLAEAVLVSPDEGFEDIVGVSDTFIPSANIWVGEYPYLDKVAMRRLLASRDSKRRSDHDDDVDDDEGLDTMTYRDAWVQTQGEGEGGGSGDDLSPSASRPTRGTSEGYYDDAESDYSDDYAEVDGGEGDNPQYQGWGSAGFSSSSPEEFNGGGRRQQQWERVSGTPRPRRRRPAATRDLEEREGPFPSGTGAGEGFDGRRRGDRWGEEGTMRAGDVGDSRVAGGKRATTQR